MASKPSFNVKSKQKVNEENETRRRKRGSHAQPPQAEHKEYKMKMTIHMNLGAADTLAHLDKLF
jgi:hypothetical protein